MFGKSKLDIIREAMEAGAQIALEGVRVGRETTLEALHRDGRILPPGEVEIDDTPFHLDELVDEQEPAADLEDVLPDVLLKRAEKFAEQLHNGEMK